MKLFLLLLLPTFASAGAIYDFTASSGITGSITLVNGTQGVVQPNDILAFEFTSAPSLEPALLAGTQAGCLSVGYCGLIVHGSGLYWHAPQDWVGSENLDGYYGTYFQNDFSTVASQQWDQNSFIITDDPYIQGVPFYYDANDGELLATRVRHAVPESDPAGVLLAGLVLLIITRVFRPRRRDEKELCRRTQGAAILH